MRANLCAQLLHLLFLKELLLLVAVTYHFIPSAGHSVEMPMQLTNLILPMLIRAVFLQHRTAVHCQSTNFCSQNAQVFENAADEDRH